MTGAFPRLLKGTGFRSDLVVSIGFALQTTLAYVLMVRETN